MCRMKHHSKNSQDLCLDIDIDLFVCIALALLSCDHPCLALPCFTLTYLTLHSLSHPLDPVRSFCDSFHSKQYGVST